MSSTGTCCDRPSTVASVSVSSSDGCRSVARLLLDQPSCAAAAPPTSGQQTWPLLQPRALAQSEPATPRAAARAYVDAPVKVGEVLARDGGDGAERRVPQLRASCAVHVRHHSRDLLGQAALHLDGLRDLVLANAGCARALEERLEVLRRRGQPLRRDGLAVLADVAELLAAQVVHHLVQVLHGDQNGGGGSGPAGGVNARPKPRPTPAREHAPGPAASPRPAWPRDRPCWRPRPAAAPASRPWPPPWCRPLAARQRARAVAEQWRNGGRRAAESADRGRIALGKGQNWVTVTPVQRQTVSASSVVQHSYIAAPLFSGFCRQNIVRAVKKKNRPNAVMRNRTADLVLTRHTLCHLSYEGDWTRRWMRGR